MLASAALRVRDRTRYHTNESHKCREGGCSLEQQFSKRGPPTSCSSTPWEPVRNAVTALTPEPLNQELGVGVGSAGCG